MNKKKIGICVLCLIIILDVFIFKFGSEINSSNYHLTFSIEADKNLEIQVFYAEDLDIKSEQVLTRNYDASEGGQVLDYSLSSKTQYIRLDFGSEPSELKIKDLIITYKNEIKLINIEELFNNLITNNMIDTIKVNDKLLEIVTNGEDPHILVDLTYLNVDEWIEKQDEIALNIEKIIICIIMDCILIGIYFGSTKLFLLPREIYRNRRLIYKMAKNDFKTKYAGSYFGIFWAFVQPVVTILLYWFVFQVGLRSNNVGDYPFVLWLIAGLVPWFFYSDSLSYGTNVLLEYNYLVKKVVFNISILPVVKSISAIFVHLFFILFMLIVFIIMGFYPTIYSIQIAYYTLCVFVFTLSLTYCTSAIILFFRDLVQIINILLQIGIWTTPIMWSADTISDSYNWILKVNPMYYIVRGYRDSLLDKVWFTQHLGETFYFWICVGGLFAIGTTVFKRLKPHFADVL